jgi:hypothetical protein
MKNLLIITSGIIVLIFLYYLLIFDSKEFLTNVDPNISTNQDKWSMIQNGINNLCLDLHYPNQNQEDGYQGDWAILSECDNSTSQLWKVTGNKSIVNYTQNACLEPDVPNAPNGANVGLYYCDEESMPGGNQTWNFIPLDNGSYQIQNKVGKDCLDIQEYKFGKNANVFIWPCNDADPSQSWYLIPSTGGPLDKRNTFHNRWIPFSTYSLNTEDQYFAPPVLNN